MNSRVPLAELCLTYQEQIASLTAQLEQAEAALKAAEAERDEWKAQVEDERATVTALSEHHAATDLALAAARQREARLRELIATFSKAKAAFEEVRLSEDRWLWKQTHKALVQAEEALGAAALEEGPQT